jgi:hypothetical protein
MTDTEIHEDGVWSTVAGCFSQTKKGNVMNINNYIVVLMEHENDVLAGTVHRSVKSLSTFATMKAIVQRISTTLGVDGCGHRESVQYLFTFMKRLFFTVVDCNSFRVFCLNNKILNATVTSTMQAAIFLLL